MATLSLSHAVTMSDRSEKSLSQLGRELNNGVTREPAFFSLLKKQKTKNKM